MKKLTIIIIAIILIVVLAFVFIRPNKQAPQLPNTNQPDNGAAGTNDAVTASDVSSVDSATNDVNVSDFSDSALDGLG